MKFLILMFALSLPALAAETLPKPQTVDEKFAILESRINNLETEVASLNAQLEGQADAAINDGGNSSGNSRVFRDADNNQRLQNLENKTRANQTQLDQMKMDDALRRQIR